MPAPAARAAANSLGSDALSRKNRPLWEVTLDGDCDCYAMHQRHYPAKLKPGQKKIRQFVGPGDKLVLRTPNACAYFVWRKFIDDSDEQGVNCAAFRNEGKHLSSTLIRQADRIADKVWTDNRHYTFVNPKAVRSQTPGRCFIEAGWRDTGRMTKSGLMIFERMRPMAIKWTELNPPERKRTYRFPCGEVEFENVVRVEVRESGKHRIETAAGRKAFVSPGWISLEIDTDKWTF